jgi:hypothetical protein
MRIVLGNAARRLVDLTVLGFAAYAFVFVPLGKHTAYQHLLSVLSSKESVKAGAELKQAGHKLANELLTQAQTHAHSAPEAAPHPAHGQPVIPKLAPANFSMVPAAPEERVTCAVGDDDSRL